MRFVMSTSDPPLPAHWQFYNDCSHQTHHGRVNDFGYGREELLWETLAAIEKGVTFIDACRRRLQRIAWNRAKKYRRLRRWLLRRPPADGKIASVHSSGGRERLGGQKHVDGARANPEGARATCPECGKAMTPAEENNYGSRCEDCWACRAAEAVADGRGAVVQGISVDQVRAMLSPGEWEVECRLSAGQTYAEVASDRGLSPDALKVSASRWRARIRPKLAVLAWRDC
jgi:hypothetical protein